MSFCLSLFSWVSAYFFQQFFWQVTRTLEEQYISKDLNQAVNKLDDELFTLSSIVSDWGPWDDTVDFVNGNDPNYIKSNLQAPAFDNLNLNLIVITDNNGEVIFSGAYDLQNKTMVPVPAFFSGQLDRKNPLMEMSDPHHITAGILMLPEDPMLVVSQPVVHSDFSGPAQGVMIMGRYLNKEEIARLAELTQPSITFTRIDDPVLPPNLISRIRTNSGSSPGIIQQMNSDQVAGYAIIRDIYGNEGLVLQITESRDIYHQGINTTVQVILIMLAGGLCLGLLVIFLLDRVVLKRMRSLADQVNTIGKSGSIRDHIEIDGDDELSGLATEIDRMLVTIDQVQKKVQASEARFRELAEQLPLIIFEMDTEGNLNYVNKAGVDRFGVTEQKIRDGINIRHFLSPENIEQMQRGLFAVMSGAKSPGEIYTLKQIDGNVMQAIVYTSLIHRQGRVFRFRGIVLDISERIRLEEALTENEEKYRALAENSADIIFSLDMAGNFSYISPQINKYGFLEDEIRGKPILSFVHPEDIVRVKNDLNRDLETGAQFHSTFRILDKWGNVHWFDENGTLRLDQSGKPIGIYGVLRDDSERKRAKDAIELANKKLNLMNNITRHDILNTITGLLGCVDMANATNSSDERMQLLNDIKDLTRIIQRQIAFTKEYQEVGVHLPLWQNVNTVITRVLQNFSASSPNIFVEMENVEIYADPMLEKVFYNLVDNAIRYGENITTIKFYSRIDDKGLSVLCEDDGAGIPPEDKTRIFERGVGRNTGMGLFLTREILGITGITIMENGVYGKGARFEIHIPRGTFRFVR